MSSSKFRRPVYGIKLGFKAMVRSSFRVGLRHLVVRAKIRVICRGVGKEGPHKDIGAHVCVSVPFTPCSPHFLLIPHQSTGIV